MAKAREPRVPQHIPRRKRAVAQIHPVYFEREASNEHALLEVLIARDPPVGGLIEYVRTMGQQEQQT